MSSGEAPSPVPKGDPQFHTTRWSVVLAAADRHHDSSREALAELCQVYWFPVYAFVRQRIASKDEAQDLTQEFFTRLLEKDYLHLVRQERGRFRTFLRTAVHGFLCNEWARARAQKRGGGRKVLSLDFASGESRLVLEPMDEETLEQEFDRQWALQLLEVVETRLRDEYSAAGKVGQYLALKPLLIGGRTADRPTAVAQQLGMTVGAVKTAVYRMRRRYRKLLRDEIAQTVTAADELEDEIQRLFSALA